MFDAYTCRNKEYQLLTLMVIQSILFVNNHVWDKRLIHSNFISLLELWQGR